MVPILDMRIDEMMTIFENTALKRRWAFNINAFITLLLKDTLDNRGAGGKVASQKKRRAACWPKCGNAVGLQWMSTLNTWMISFSGICSDHYWSPRWFYWRMHYPCYPHKSTSYQRRRFKNALKWTIVEYECKMNERFRGKYMLQEEFLMEFALIVNITAEVEAFIRYDLLWSEANRGMTILL